MRSRLELQSLLEKVIGNRNVYFQPPNNLRMHYPAIRYSLSNVSNRHADNTPYTQYNEYELTIIDYDPDSPIVKAVSSLPFCRFDRSYKADNLNHTIFKLYF